MPACSTCQPDAPLSLCILEEMEASSGTEGLTFSCSASSSNTVSPKVLGGENAFLIHYKKLYGWRKMKVVKWVHACGWWVAEFGMGLGGRLPWTAPTRARLFCKEYIAEHSESLILKQIQNHHNPYSTIFHFGNWHSLNYPWFCKLHVVNYSERADSKGKAIGTSSNMSALYFFHPWNKRGK